MNVDDAEWDDIDHAEDCWPDEDEEADGNAAAAGAGCCPAG